MPGDDTSLTIGQAELTPQEKGNSVFISDSVVVYEGLRSSLRTASESAITPDALANLLISRAAPPSGTVLVQQRAQEYPEEVIRFFVALQPDESEPAFLSKSLRSLPDATRNAAVSARKIALEAKQNRAVNKIETLGGVVLSRRWLVDGLVVEATGTIASDILALDGVKGAWLSEGEAQAEALVGYDGLDVRADLDTQSFASAYYKGSYGGRAGGRVRVGFVEPLNRMACYHKGFHDYFNGPSRLQTAEVCSQSGCAAGWCASYLVQAEYHPINVASIAIGSIEAGQDPNYPGSNTTEQERRSGIASEAWGYYYALYPADGCNAVLAIETAVADGIDILNMSMGFEPTPTEPWCSATRNDCGLNEAISAALDAGVLVVKSSGNRNYTDYCSTTYPAQLPNVLAVTGVSTWHNTWDPYIPYFSTTFTQSGAAGKIALLAWNGTSVEHSTVGLAAPFTFQHMAYNYTPFAFYETLGQSGTSLSSPVVSGIAALLKQSFKAHGWNADDDAREILANTLLLGDGYYGGTIAGGKYSNYISEKVGYGRVYGRYPYSPDLGTTSGWDSRSDWLLPNQTIVIDVGPPPTRAAEASNVLGLKWVVLSDWDTLYFPPKIAIRAVDTCPSGGWSRLVVATGSSLSAIRHKLRLPSSSVANRCLQLEIEAVSIPSGGIGLHSAYYYYSSSINGEH